MKGTGQRKTPKTSKFLLPILLVCSTAAIRKHSKMLTLPCKCCITRVMFPLDTFTLPLDTCQNLRGVAHNWEA